MIELFTEQEYQEVKSHTSLNLECYTCKKPFPKKKKDITRVRNGYKRQKNKFCSVGCQDEGKKRLITKPCSTCGKEVTRQQCVVTKSKTGNVFCNSSCSASYSNRNKTHGYRRSQAEVFLEEKLKMEYPALDVQCNNKTAIGSELDFYFPALKTAIEVSGIFHFDPIYGEVKLLTTQANDMKKVASCDARGIDLHIVKNCYSTFNQKTKDLLWSEVSDIMESNLASI